MPPRPCIASRKSWGWKCPSAAASTRCSMPIWPRGRPCAASWSGTGGRNSTEEIPPRLDIVVYDSVPYIQQFFQYQTASNCVERLHLQTKTMHDSMRLPNSPAYNRTSLWESMRFASVKTHASTAYSRKGCVSGLFGDSEASAFFVAWLRLRHFFTEATS